MIISIGLWLILVMIGVFDAREHRIPNILVTMLIIFNSIAILIYSDEQSLLDTYSDKLGSFFICFVVGLILYVTRIMSAGDVKLLSAIGFILGTNALSGFLFYLFVMTAFVGLMYIALNHLRLKQCTVNKRTPRRDDPWLYVSVNIDQRINSITRTLTKRESRTYMPFAPVIVIGLAMYQYIAF